MTKKKKNSQKKRAKNSITKKSVKKNSAQKNKKHELKKKGKKDVEKTRGKGVATSKGRSKERKRAVPKSKQLSKQKLDPKTGTKNKAKVSGKSGDKKRAVSSRKTSTAQLIVDQTSGRVLSRQQIDYTFKGVKSIQKKLELFERYADDSLIKQFKRKGGKPPRGVVVVVTGKKGKGKKSATVEIGKVSPFDFVVNKKNVKAFVKGIIEKIRDDAEEFMDMGDADGSEDFLEDHSGADVNPDSIESIMLKFIY